MKQSQKLFNHAQLLIPGGVNSPVRAFRSGAALPLCFKQRELTAGLARRAARAQG